MDLLKDDTHKLYKHYLLPTVGSALAMSIYSLVDTIAVGQYAGVYGTGALSVVNVLYVIMVVIAYLCATGGCVRYGNAIGKDKNDEGNEYFTASVIVCLLLMTISWIAFIFYHKQIFTLFGANEQILPYAEEYGIWIIRFFPVIIMPDFLGPFLRMDGDPKKAMHAVMAGGLLNILLDWLLVFPVGLGVKGAAIATVTGTSLQCIIMLTHFGTQKNHYRLVKMRDPVKAIGNVLTSGFSASLLDIGNAVLAILMNNRIGYYGGTDALGVYGVINTLSVLIQALYAGVGQTIQPLISVNNGASKHERVEKLRKYGVQSALAMGFGLLVIGELFPYTILSMFMTPSPEILAIASRFIRFYFLGYPWMGYCIVMTYYLQSIMRRKSSSLLALSRSVLLPSILLTILPILFRIDGVYASVPLSELLSVLLIIVRRKCSHK